MSSSAIQTTDYERIRFGACSTLDANGNPTPDDPVAAEGTILHATSYPDPIDNGTGQVTTFEGGDMVFRAVGGVWEWFGGSFRASNANGEYQRFADGKQECTAGLDDSSVAINNPTQGANQSNERLWTFPAAFSANPKVQGSSHGTVNAWFGNTTSGGLTTGQTGYRLLSVNAQVTGAGTETHLTAKGNW